MRRSLADATTAGAAAALLLLLGTITAAQATQPASLPVIFDTDIGTDIDDAYALAALMGSADLELVGVTTVSGDAVARARLAARFMAVAGGRFASVPVYAGFSTAPQYMQQTDWARDFDSPALHKAGGVEFMRQQIEARPAQLVVIAAGELTNVAALLNSSKDIGAKIRAIVLMGGSVHRGYAPGSAPEAEWNIKSNVAAARRVFTAGVPLLVAPLDSTASLALTPEMRVDVFSHGTRVTDALAALNSIWRHTNTWHAENPTLFDALAVELARPGQHYPLTPLHLQITDDGMTRVVQGASPNAQVALDVNARTFMTDLIATLKAAPRE